MNRIYITLLFTIFLFSCNSKKENSELDDKKELDKQFSEISGLAGDGNYLWAITDKPNAVVYKLNQEGKLQQEILINNVKATDVEAVTKDAGYVYLGDVGDNDGTREERQIIKVQKNKIANDKKATVSGEIITFRFNEDNEVQKKKKNNYDCEAILSLGDSLYLFTKRREDLQTELFSLPKTPGNYIARSIAIYNSRGLITDATINKSYNEVALIGYTKSHRYPFILLFSNFTGNNFFTGKMERIELADKQWDWQLEGITYNIDNKVYFACEETKEVKATLYVIRRDRLFKLNKKR